MKKIKILVDGHVFDGMFQGTRTYLKGLYQALAQRKSIQVYMAAQDIENLQQEFSECENMEFIRLESSSGAKRLCIEFPKLVKKYAIDYVHYQYMDAPIKNCRTIVTIHDVLFLDFPDDFSWLYRQKKHLFKLAAKRADLLFTVSDYSKGRIAHHFNISRSRIHVQKEAIDSSYFEQYDKKLSIKYIKNKFAVNRPITYVSRIEPRKNHALLLTAFQDLKLWKKGYELVFIGKESIKSKELELLYSKMKPEEKEKVHYFERVNQEDLLHFLKASEMFVYPTRAEGFGFPPLEAAALRVQTLLSNATSLKEFSFFENRFFSPDSLDALKEKMMLLIESPQALNSMDDISRTIQKNYNWEHIAEEFEQKVIMDYMAK